MATRTFLAAPILLFLAAAAHAEPKAMVVGGLELSELCNQFSGAQSVNSCLRAGAGLPFDPKAGALCNQFSGLSSVITCVSAAAGRRYTENEIRVCNQYSGLSSVAECLKVAGVSVGHGGGGGWGGGSESSEGLNKLCGRFNDFDVIQRCKAAAEGRPFDDKAAALCDIWGDDSSIIACISAAAGRRYTQREIDDCRRWGNAETINRCLRTSGVSVGGGGNGGSCRDAVAQTLSTCKAKYTSAQRILECVEDASAR